MNTIASLPRATLKIMIELFLRSWPPNVKFEKENYKTHLIQFQLHIFYKPIVIFLMTRTNYQLLGWATWQTLKYRNDMKKSIIYKHKKDTVNDIIQYIYHILKGKQIRRHVFSSVFVTIVVSHLPNLSAKVSRKIFLWLASQN